MKPTAHFEMSAACWSRHRAVAYLRLVSREPSMLRRIVANFYRRLPVVRELHAIVREHQKITASLLRVENYLKAGD
jgi:hypothetical protein